MPKRRRAKGLSWSVFLWTAAVLASATAPGVEPPRVIGFERFYANETADPVAGGWLLLGELNCTSCHQADDSFAHLIVRKPAPVLDAVGSRVQPQYLLQFLSNPQATKPGTTMPNMLASVPEEERGPIVESLVHFLATTGSVTRANPLRLSVDRGERLFHTIGCTVCHDPRSDPGHAPLPTSVPLGVLSRKYTLPSLTQFLLEPLAVRTGGRMPDLGLSPTEAREIASYLLNDLDILSGLQYAYYEGDWEKLPEFAGLEPVAIGTADGFDLRLARRRDHFALRFEGTIRIDQAGEYLFLLGSDDGSRLLIDNKLVVANDGVHAFEQRRKKVKMTAGLHSVTVEYFEQQGEEVLQLDFEGPGQTQQPLAALLTAPIATKGSAPPPADFSIDPFKAARGREYFASLGCASCHTLRIGGAAIATKLSATPLAALVPRGGGCVDDEPTQARHYIVSPRQRESLNAVLAAVKHPPPGLVPAELVFQTMTRFNCYACHERDGCGGVEAAREACFESDTPEMGDEGRLPPHLTGIGAKLSPAWLRRVLDSGSKQRPYMFVRMPKFGGENVGHLAPLLEQVDAALVKPAPPVSVPPEDERKFKAAGRRLVGAQGFSCIKCHTFADKRSTGIQAISLTTMTQRLRPEWFHHYLLNPMAYRPGTRMPTPFPDGQTTLPSVLDGKAETQIAAIWKYLSDGERALQPVGLVTGKIELIAFDEAVIYRNFIEGAGPRAIAVAYPEKLNLAFDANQMRPALLWHGAFIDAARHWSARGAGFEGPLGDNILRLPGGSPLAILPSADAAWPDQPAKELGYQFRGYRLDEKRRPTFLYSYGELNIEDRPQPVGSDEVFTMHRTLTITANRPAANVWLRAMVADKIRHQPAGTAAEQPPAAFRIDDRWLLGVESVGKARLREQNGQVELLVPVEFHANRAQIELTYDW